MHIPYLCGGTGSGEKERKGREARLVERVEGVVGLPEIDLEVKEE
jgi:hypothetical protein